MSTRKSLAFSFLDRYAGLAISVVSSMVIARLLTPTEIGVFSIVMVLLTFVSTIRDMGAGQYMVQEKELTIERIRAVWAVQLGLGLGLAALVLMASYPVSVFYNEPRMFPIMLLVALNYAVNPFGSLTYAWLMREMRFESIAVMRFSSGLGGALVAVGLAWQGLGPISLAFGSLTSTVVNALIAVLFRPKGFPWLPSLSEVKRVLAFGSRLTASSIMTVASNSAPELLVGKMQSLTAAGLYSRSSGLVQMFQRLFVDAVVAVCLPWFAAQSRDNGDAKASFLKATSYVSALGWSFCLVIVCLAHPIVRILYGPQWDAAVDLARLLAVAAAFSVPAALCQAALLSSGCVSLIAKVNLFCALQSIFFVALGAFHGTTALGIAIITAAAVTSAAWLQATLAQLGLSFGHLFLAMRRSAVVALSAGIGPGLIVWIYGPYPQSVVLAAGIGGVTGMIGLIAGIFVAKHPLSEELYLVFSKLKEHTRRDGSAN